MTDAQFWSIIEDSRNDDRDKQVEALKVRLTALSPQELEAFEATFDAQMKKSYSWDLWGAAFVAMGGASDDSFEYFRLWLIARGAATFNAVINDPDSLADIAPDNPIDLEFEELAYVAPNIWSEKTGKPWDSMPLLASFFSPSGYDQPSGKPFKENRTDLAARYPKLWAHFRSH